MTVQLASLLHHRVGKLSQFGGVFHGVDVIAHQAPGLALATNVGHPFERDGGVFRVFFGIGKGAENRPQQMVADLFRVIDLIQFVGRVFPVPLAIDGHVVLGDGHGPRHGREGGWLVAAFRVPQHAGSHHAHVGLLRTPEIAVFVPAFVKLVPRFAALAEFRAGPETEPAVAGGIDEHRREKTADPPARRFARLHTGDLVSFFAETDGEMPGEKVGARFEHGFFAFLLVHQRLGIAVRVVAGVDFPQQFRALAMDADGVDADFRAGVAAEHRPVLDQRHLESLGAGRQCRAASGHPAADNHQIVLLLRDFQPRAATEPVLPGRQLGQIFIRQGGRFLPGEENGIAAAIEAGHVLQLQQVLAGFGDFDFAA